jgi:hypothetical protein
MRFSVNRFNRKLKRLGLWLVPDEARELTRHQRIKAIAAATALLLYADGSRACVTVSPDSVTAAVISERTIDQVSLDRASSAVHASLRRPSQYRTRSLDDPSLFTEPEPAALPPAAPPPRGIPQAEALAGAPGVVPLTPARAITQGEFAVMLASTLRLRPPRRVWSAADASTALSALRLQAAQAVGVVPPGGWRLDGPLSEGDLAVLLAHLGLHVIPQDPERPITPEEAEQVLARLASLFRSLSPAAYASSPAGPSPISPGNPRAPLSPSTP